MLGAFHVGGCRTVQGNEVVPDPSEDWSDHLCGTSSKDQVRDTSGRGFPPCCLQCVSAVPQSLLHDESTTASCGVHLWKFSPASAHLGLDVCSACTEVCPGDQAHFISV